jgi:hypothetical protein
VCDEDDFGGFGDEKILEVVNEEIEEVFLFDCCDGGSGLAGGVLAKDPLSF